MTATDTGPDTGKDSTSQAQAQAGTWADEIERLERIAPEWVRDFQETDPFVAPRNDVQRLIDSAPDAWARGLIQGLDMFRVQLALATGRPYEFVPQTQA